MLKEAYKKVIQCSYRGIFIYFYFLLLGINGKSKICNFGPSIVDKNIGNFKVSMNNIHFRKVQKALKDIFDKRCSLFFRQKAFSFDIHIQVSSIA